MAFLVDFGVSLDLVFFVSFGVSLDLDLGVKICQGSVFKSYNLSYFQCKRLCSLRKTPQIWGAVFLPQNTGPRLGLAIALGLAALKLGLGIARRLGFVIALGPRGCDALLALTFARFDACG